MKNPHAVALGRLGGNGRARKSTVEQRSEWARLGGIARAEQHPKAKLSKWARKGGRPKKGDNK